MADDQYIFVAEITMAVDDAGTTELHLACTGEGFATRPSDVPANVPVPPTLLDPGSLRRELFSGNRMFGAVRPAFGEIVLYNGDGRYDAWEPHGFDGRPVTVRWGRRGAAYPAGYTVCYVATMEGITLTETQARLRLRDGLALLDKPVISEVFAGTGGAEGGSELEGQARQRMFGRCLYPPAQTISTGQLVYHVSLGALSGTLQVWDSGVQLTRGITYADLESFLDLGNAPDPGYFSTYGAGPSVYIRLGSRPVGDIRLLGTFVREDGVVWTIAAMLARAGYAGPVTGTPIPLKGLVVDEPGTTWLQVIEEMARAAGMFFTFDRLGRFRSGVVEPPAGVFVPTLTRQNCLSIRRSPADGMPTPAHALSVNAGRAWKSSLAAGATVTRREFDKDTWYERYTYTDEAVLLKHPAASGIHLDVQPRLTGAQWEALRQRYVSLFFVGRRLITAVVPMSAAMLAIDLMDTVRVQWPRFGLADGVLLRVVAVRHALAQRQIEFSLWG